MCVNMEKVWMLAMMSTKVARSACLPCAHTTSDPPPPIDKSGAKWVSEPDLSEETRFDLKCIAPAAVRVDGLHSARSSAPQLLLDSSDAGATGRNCR